MHNAYSAAWARVTSTCPCNSELDTSEIRVILMQHAEVAPLSKRGGRHKPIRVSLWPLHPWPIWSWWWTNFHIAPRCDLESWVSYYWHLGFPDTKIADHALDHFDRNLYGLRYFCQAYIQKLKKTDFDSTWIIAAKSLSKGSWRIWVSKEPYNKLPPSKLLKRSTRFFEHAFQQWEPVE